MIFVYLNGFDVIISKSDDLTSSYTVTCFNEYTPESEIISWIDTMIGNYRLILSDLSGSLKQIRVNYEYDTKLEVGFVKGECVHAEILDTATDYTLYRYNELKKVYLRGGRI